MHTTNQSFLRIFALSIFAASLAVVSACKKKEEVKPSDTSATSSSTTTTTTTPPPPSSSAKLNQTPSSNTVVADQAVYTKDRGSSVFSSPARSVVSFTNPTSKKRIELTVALPNTNPKSGDYELLAYGSNGDIIPKGKVAIKYTEYSPEYKEYYSIVDKNTLVKVENFGDSVQVTYENISLTRTYYEVNSSGAYTLATAKVLVSGKYKVKTTPLPSTFKGSATFTDGSANTVSAGKNTAGRYFYGFSGGSGAVSLVFEFTEKLTSSKNYTIVSRPTYEPGNANEVSISILTRDLVNYVPNETGKTLSVTKNADGSFSLSFGPMSGHGTDFSLRTYSKSISGTATFTEILPE